MSEITFRQLLAEFADRFEAGMDRMQAAKAAKLLARECADPLAEGGRIELRGFGSFGLRFFEARMSRNPQNGELVWAPARARVFFRAGRDLAQRVNESRSRANVQTAEARGGRSLSDAKAWGFRSYEHLIRSFPELFRMELRGIAWYYRCDGVQGWKKP